MVSQPNKRPPRQPLSYDEVREIIRLKRLRKEFLTEKFKKSVKFKLYNVFNVFAVLVYTEIIFSFLSSCNFTTHYVQSVTPFYGQKVMGNKRVFSHALVMTVGGKEYDLSIQDTCRLPVLCSKIIVGHDWILQKELKVRFGNFENDYFIHRSFPLLFISILFGVLTLVLFNYNMNEIPHSLNVITLINFLSIFSFLLH